MALLPRRSGCGEIVDNKNAEQTIGLRGIVRTSLINR